MFSLNQNLSFDELEDTGLLEFSVKNASERRDSISKQHDCISELNPEEASLVIGGCCDHELFITCGMYCDLV